MRFRRCGSHAAVAEVTDLAASDRRQRTPERRPHRPGLFRSCFAPVVVSPVAGGKFAIIDGQHRTTAATLVGFDSVPCQIVIAAKEEQAAAFKAINGTTTPISIMALHAAALMACSRICRVVRPR
jgi:ParB-like nuclease domain